MTSRTVLVPAGRVGRWFANFADRHGAFEASVADGALHALAADSAEARARLPFSRAYDGPADPAAFADAVAQPCRWGVLLVRKGGFAVALLDGDRIVASKVGQRHVQGRTKAGGQSQQRFARRRGNQARQAFEAAADHAHRVLVEEAGDGALAALVCGGDRAAVDEVLADTRLARLAGVRAEPWLAVPDPRRQVLEQAVRDGASASLTVTDPPDDRPEK